MWAEEGVEAGVACHSIVDRFRSFVKPGLLPSLTLTAGSACLASVYPGQGYLGRQIQKNMQVPSVLSQIVLNSIKH